jgi:hypothetical protein
MDFRQKFVEKPGAKVRLGDIDPAYKGEHDSHQTGAAELARHTASLAQLQYKLYAEDKRALLIVLQGLDALVVSLTQVRVPRSMPFAAAIADYHNHRVKKLKKQGRT